jgi:PIN domain nuclease of toxin-antitoxin system
VTIVTDTHPWVWFLTANSRLSEDARSSLSNPSHLIIVPSIVMLEIRYLYNRKRIPISFEEVLEQLETTENILIHPLDVSVASIAPMTLEIYDAIIVGTTIYLSKELGQVVSLVTNDKAITDSGLVPVIW